MEQRPPIVLIENNSDDLRTIGMAMRVLNVPSPFHSFASVEQALAFLRTTGTRPGLILCSQELAPAIFRDEAAEQLAFPIVLFGWNMSAAEIAALYRLPVQGVFNKEASFGNYLDILDRILKYWLAALQP